MSAKAGTTKIREYLAVTAGIADATSVTMSGADLTRAALIQAAGNPAGAAQMGGARLSQLATLSLPQS